jgi:hypothetical protein
MSSSSGPILSGKSDIYFLIDTHNLGTGVSYIGCGGYNGSTDGVVNLINGNKTLFSNGVKVSNKTYYTSIGISYPEGSYGGDAANCHGLSSGYNVRTYGNVYGASRSLHMWVWDNDGDAWVPDSYFRGARLNGHCYDNYAGAENGWTNEVKKFDEDFYRISGKYPNATFIFNGSHACQCFSQSTVDNMISLGAPSSTVSSWTDNSTWREFILVGRPGLGSGNAYGWAYENYPTNPSQVGHLNFGLEIKNLGEIELDGTDDYLTFTGLTGHQLPYGTIEAWCYPTSTSGDRYVFSIGENQVYGASRAIRINSGYWSTVTYGGGDEDYNSIVAVTANQWVHVAFTWYGISNKFYLNGVEYSTTKSGLKTPQGGRMAIGCATWSLGNSLFAGKIGSVKGYSKGLTATEIQNNYNRTKSQYGL